MIYTGIGFNASVIITRKEKINWTCSCLKKGAEFIDFVKNSTMPKHIPCMWSQYAV